MIYLVKMFRICSEFSANVQNFQQCSDRLCSEYLAQKLVCSEFLDCSDLLNDMSNTCPGGPLV